MLKMPNDAIITINRKFNRPSAELIKPFSKVPTGYVVDVQGRRGALDCSIKPMFDCPTIAGPAVTVQTVPDDNLVPYLAMEVLQAGDVLVIANGGWTGSSVVGDLIVGMFKNIGVAGIVTDGAVRDVAGLRQVGVPVYARGLTANSPQKNGPGSVGLEVSIGGTVVRSGDLIVCDQDGVVVLPQEKIPSALEGLGAIREKERKIEALIAEGLTKPDWVKEFLAGDRVNYIG
jgi:4-hydroxy-4-methyl-2-oxoglutarate aldolase